MRIYKLYANITASGNNLANVTIVKSGRIKSIRWDLLMNSVVDNDGVEAELSLYPASMIGSSDSAGALDQISTISNGTAGGDARASKQSLVDIPVGQGEKLYLNSSVQGTPTFGHATCFIDVDE